MSDLSIPISLDSLVEPLAERLAEVLGPLLAEKSPWMTKEEAIEYTRLAPGTFKMYAADGRIPSHGGKTKIFRRDELDEALRRL